jgi:hypothetical protein
MTAGKNNGEEAVIDATHREPGQTSRSTRDTFTLFIAARRTATASPGLPTQY